MSSFRSFGIDTAYTRGQGYDGAAAWSGAFNGLQAHVSRDHPLSIYTNFAANLLNLVVYKVCEVVNIRIYIDVIGKAHDFFSLPKLKDILRKEIENLEFTTNVKTFKRNCAAR